MLGHYVGDLLLFKKTNIIGVIVEVPKHPTGLFKIMWSDGLTGVFDIREVRNFKYALEDKLNETAIS
jgi:hypothetical protein